MSPQIDRAVLTLREMILRGDFRPGERISEVALAARLNVSRTPLRLALDRLCHEGLLERWPRGGFTLRGFALDGASKVRGVLEGTAERLAAGRLTSTDEVATLRECCDRMEEMIPVTADAFGRYFEWINQFHAELTPLAKSAKVAEALQRIAHEQHRAIVEAIGNREGARAEALAREHSRVARKNLTRTLGDGQLLGNLRGASLLGLSAAPASRRKRRRSSS